MAASTAIESVFDVKSFIEKYYDAWGGTDLDLIMSFYSENVVIEMPGLLMEGKEAVRDQFVRPFTTAFVGNRYLVKHMIHRAGVVTVEFSFGAPGHTLHARRLKRKSAEGFQRSMPQRI